MKRSNLIMLFALALGATTAARERTMLTLDQAIAIALEKSYQMKALRLSLIQSEQNLVAARNRFRTNASLALNTPYWRESVSEIQVAGQLPVYNTIGDIRYQGTLDISQPLPTNGSLRLQSQAYHRDVSTYELDLDQTKKRSELISSVSLRFTQPLFSLNTLKLNLTTANLNFERTRNLFRRSELNIIYSVTNAFFDLYQSTRALQIAQDNLRQQQELYELAAKKYASGLIPEVEALQMEVDLAQSRSDLLSAEVALWRNEDEFKQLVGIQLQDSVGVKTDFQYQPFVVEEAAAVQRALKYRSELRENEISVELARLNVKEVDARKAIRGDIDAFYDLTGVSDSNLPYGSTWAELWTSSQNDMKRRPHNRGVVFSLSVPLWDWGVNSAEVQSAQAALENGRLMLQEEKVTIQRQVREVVSRLRESESRMQVLQRNQEVAQRAFDISLARFNNGDITSQELALDRNRLTQAKTSYLNAYIDYKLAAADLKRKTMWDWEKDRPLVE
ncbi:MAG TPA: TolC family protein [bacterium]|nr:TolC family protein [bacterium]